MQTNPEIFKAYDIRGVYGQDLDEETAYKLGQAYAELRREESEKDVLDIVVGADMRNSGPELKKSLIKGLLDSGFNVVDIGLVSTPSFYFAVANYGYDGGIMVSASHNPAEYNGFKLVREKSLPISRDTGINLLRDMVMAGDFEKAQKKGELSKKEGILADEVDFSFKVAQNPELKKFKIVADPANSMGAQFLEVLFSRLNSDLIKINFDLDGNFPSHEADPLKEENLEQLKEKVLAEEADLGIATDGDGDRIFFVDDKGQTISPALVRGLLSQAFLAEKPGSKICYDIRPGKITEDLILEAGGTPIITPVGHSLIKEIAIREGAYFAGESSGHFFLNSEIGCFEMPMVMILKLLEIFSNQEQKISDYLTQFNRYSHSGEINREVSDKEAVFTRLEEEYSDGEISKLDGITVKYPGFWFNVRASNTENKMRLNLEAENEEIMKEKRDEVLELIR